MSDDLSSLSVALVVLLLLCHRAVRRGAVRVSWRIWVEVRWGYGSVTVRSTRGLTRP